MNILITGASSGIGLYLAKNLLTNNNIYSISRSINNLEGMFNFYGNINDDNFIDDTISNLPKIDYLILNAGVGYFDKFKNISLEKHLEVLNTNLISNIKLIYKISDKINIGIIFIGSVSSKKSSSNGASYSASKFGIRGFAMQLKNENLFKKVFFINPKIVKTNFHNNSKIEIVGKYQETNIDDIFQTVNNILNGVESRFEIDL